MPLLPGKEVDRVSFKLTPVLGSVLASGSHCHFLAQKRPLEALSVTTSSLKFLGMKGPLLPPPESSLFLIHQASYISYLSHCDKVPATAAEGREDPFQPSESTVLHS